MFFFYKAPNVPSILVGSKDFFVPPEAVLDYVFFQVLPSCVKHKSPSMKKLSKLDFLITKSKNTASLLK